MSNRTWFAIAAIGRDRPGIVADLAECVFECGGNLEDASMTMLGNEFATLMLVSGVGEEIAESLAAATKRLEWERHLTIFLRPLSAAPEHIREDRHSNFRLTATGVDQAGIVAGVSRCLADRQVLIGDLRGSTQRVPQSGTPLYTLVIEMLPPSDCDLAELRLALDAVGDRLNLEITLSKSDDSNR